MTDNPQVPVPLRIATRDERIKARLVTTGVAVGAILVIGGLLQLVGEDSVFGSVVGNAALLGLIGWWLWLMLAKAQTPGYRFTGLIAVDPRTGAKAGVNLLVKHILYGLVGGVSCGLAEPIVSLATFDERGTWFDRTAGVLVVHVTSVGTASPAATSTPTVEPASGITPVVATLEDTPALAEPTQVVDHERDADSRDAGRGGPEPVVTDRAPIQSVPGRPRTAHRVPITPDTPVTAVPPITAGPPVAEAESPPSPLAQAAPPPVPAPPAPAQVPPIDGPAGGVITGVPLGIARPVVAPTPVESQPVTPPDTPVSGAAEPVVDHTLVDDSLQDAATTPVLRFDDGTLHLVAPALLLGRAPVPLADHPDAAPLAITDPAMKVSKTHLLVAHDGRSLTVTDLGSTNGVRVAAPGAQPRRLTPWEAHPVQVGERVQLGSRSFEVAG